MKQAGIYARISLDRDGDAEGVERQVEDAEALAEARGLAVADRFVDNDRSAYNGKIRPEWDRMLAEVHAGRIDVVVAWANDRLYRRTVDQLALMEAVRIAGGTIVTVKDGEVDPASAEGRMRMGILANVAEFESARKAERVSRAAEQRAASGRPHGRPSYGWTLDGVGEWMVEPDQAAMIREAAYRVLHGESCGSVCRDWNAQGLPRPAAASAWDHRALRKVLLRPANAGLRIHRGQIAGSATWAPILDLETWEAVRSRLTAPRGHSRPRRYLLTTLLTCTADEGSMVGHKANFRSYECRTCGRMVTADRLDEFVIDRVMEKLATPRLAERLARARNDSKESDALRDLDRAHTRLAELAQMFGNGDLDLAEYRSARSAAQARRSDAERRLTSRRSSRVLGDALGSPDGIRGVWERQPISWRRELIRAVVERIEIGPSTKPAWEPERVRMVWRA